MIIRLENVTKIYKLGAERIHALAGLHLEVRENEYLAIIGPSGSGKTTLLNIIGCLDHPTSGTYELDGKPIHNMNSGALAKIRNEKIGFVFQGFELLPRLNILKNVALPLIYSGVGWYRRHRRAKQMLQQVRLGDRIRHRPNQLSGGERQRVAIARALITNPGILLADEPTGNLDSKTGDEILGLFAELHRRGQTIIAVTHEERVARDATRIIRIEDGQVCSNLPAEKDEIYGSSSPSDSTCRKKGGAK